MGTPNVTARMPTTFNRDLELLFDDALIPREPYEWLQERGYNLRPLGSTDYHRGHLEPLTGLTSTPDIGEKAWVERFNLMKSLSATYYIVVIVDKHLDTIVGTGSLMVEHKFIRGAAKVGHVEDIAVSKSAQGKKLGLYLIKALTGLSEALGCYKTILDCSEENRAFYEKCGYEHKGAFMGKYV